MPMGGLFGWGGEMNYLDHELTELGKDKLFFYQIACNHYKNMQQTEYLKKFDPCNDTMIVFLKFKSLVTGFITKQEQVEMDEKMRPSLYALRKNPNTCITFKDTKPSVIEQSITLSTDKFEALIGFCSKLRKLFNTLAISGFEITYSETHKYLLSQINASVFLELYRDLSKLEQLPLYNRIGQLATIGGNIKSQEIKYQENYRIEHLEKLINLMTHNEIMDLLSTKRNCFNKLFELDYDYQQANNTITKSKLSLQHIKNTVMNQDGTYNLASTSVGKWLVKNMGIYFWMALKNKPNYKEYSKIDWFKEYLQKNKTYKTQIIY